VLIEQNLVMLHYEIVETFWIETDRLRAPYGTKAFGCSLKIVPKEGNRCTYGWESRLNCWDRFEFTFHPFVKFRRERRMYHGKKHLLWEESHHAEDRWSTVKSPYGRIPYGMRGTFTREELPSIEKDISKYKSELPDGMSLYNYMLIKDTMDRVMLVTVQRLSKFLKTRDNDVWPRLRIVE